MAIQHTYERQDASLTQSKALPSSAGTVVTTAVDLGAANNRIAKAELKIEAPALNATQLPDAATTTYKLEESSDNSTWSDLKAAIITQTGASSAGAAEATKRYKIASDGKRYVRLSATSATTPGDQSAASMTISLRT